VRTRLNFEPEGVPSSCAPRCDANSTAALLQNVALVRASGRDTAQTGSNYVGHIARRETHCFHEPWMVCIPLGPKLVTVLSDGAFLALTELVSTADAKRLVELAANATGLGEPS
jgi:hypothetical protein